VEKAEGHATPAGPAGHLFDLKINSMQFMSGKVGEVDFIGVAGVASSLELLFLRQGGGDVVGLGRVWWQ